MCPHPSEIYKNASDLLPTVLVTDLFVFFFIWKFFWGNIKVPESQEMSGLKKERDFKDWNLHSPGTYMQYKSSICWDIESINNYTNVYIINKKKEKKEKKQPTLYRNKKEKNSKYCRGLNM